MPCPGMDPKRPLPRGRGIARLLKTKGETHMGLNRCTVCSTVTPEPDTAFCSDECCTTWEKGALEELHRVQAQLVLEAKLTQAAVQAALDARLTGVWN